MGKKKDIALLGGMEVSKEVQDMLDQLDVDDNLTEGGYATGNKISIRGSVFRQVVNGQEVKSIEDRAINVIIMKSAPLARTYYDKQYVEGEEFMPLCWSTDCTAPAEDVPKADRQSDKCHDCPQNIKGSGQGDNARACRFSKRMAVLMEGDVTEDSVYQLIAPGQSIFGDPEKDGSKMPLLAYGKFLKANGVKQVGSVLTEVRFDSASSTPKLVFKPVRPVTKEELQVVLSLLKPEHEDVTEALKMEFKKSASTTEDDLPELIETDSEEDDEDEVPEVDEVSVTKKKKKKKKKKKQTIFETSEEEDDDDTEEEDEAPTVKKKKKVEPEDGDLSSLLEAWDDD